MILPDYTYATDDYPREGCVAKIEVRPNGYALAIYDPTGRIIEGYATVKTPAAISRMLREWCEGKRPQVKGQGD